MWTLPLPATDDSANDLMRALTYANGEAIYAPTPQQITALFQLYTTYDELSGRPSPALIAATFDVDFVGAIYNGYDEVQEGRRLNSLRNRLKATTLLCPYCGFGEVRDLDHHLPRGIYRALAIYARNLVPCCSACNGKKRAVAGAAPEVQFAHVYLDAAPGELFLLAQVQVSEAAGLQAEFSIVQCAGMSADHYARLQFQLHRLDLNARYQAQVNIFVSSQRQSIEDAATGGPESLRTWLTRAHTYHLNSYGRNDWRAALFYGLAQSDDFINGGYMWCFGQVQAGA